MAKGRKGFHSERAKRAFFAQMFGRTGKRLVNKGEMAHPNTLKPGQKVFYHNLEGGGKGGKIVTGQVVHKDVANESVFIKFPKAPNMSGEYGSEDLKSYNILQVGGVGKGRYGIRRSTPTPEREGRSRTERYQEFAKAFRKLSKAERRRVPLSEFERFGR